MRFAIDVERRTFWIGAEAARSCLMRAARDGDFILHVNVARYQMMRVHAQAIEHGLQFVAELLLRYLVIGCIAEREVALPIDRHAILRVGQIFCREPEIYRVPCDVIQHTHRGQSSLDGLFAAIHLAHRLAHHLNITGGIVEAFHPEVKIIQGNRLLEHGGVWFLRDCQHRLAVMEHIITPHLVRPFASPLGCLSLADISSSLAVLAAPQETTTMSPWIVSVLPSTSTMTSVTDVPPEFVLSLSARALRSKVTFGNWSAGRMPMTSASDFACTRQGNPSQVWQRIQVLKAISCSFIITPQGAGKGW